MSPTPCGWLTSRFQGVTLYTQFAQAYGRFEARIKFPSGPPFGSGFWMWPRDMAYGEQSGEIDIAEHFGGYPQYAGARTHIKDGAGGDRGGGEFCTVANPAGTFHKYAVQWRPTGLTFLYDGVPCWTSDRWTPPTPLTYPQPFDQPFFMLLSLGVVDPGSDATYFPAKMQVDYVRVWK